MKYIKFNEDDFIDWLSKERGVFFLELAQLKDYFSIYKNHIENKGKISLLEIKEIVDAVSLPYEFNDLPKKYAQTQLSFICYDLSRKYTTLTFKEIGLYYNKKDLSTIRDGLLKFNERKYLGYYKEFKEIYDICNSYLIEKRKNLDKN